MFKRAVLTANTNSMVRKMDMNETVQCITEHNTLVQCLVGSTVDDDFTFTLTGIPSLTC